MLGQLTEKNTEVITKLNLQDLQKDKEAFKNNMSKFEMQVLKIFQVRQKIIILSKNQKSFFSLQRKIMI